MPTYAILSEVGANRYFETPGDNRLEYGFTELLGVDHFMRNKSLIDSPFPFARIASQAESGDQPELPVLVEKLGGNSIGTNDVVPPVTTFSALGIPKGLALIPLGADW